MYIFKVYKINFASEGVHGEGGEGGFRRNADLGVWKA